MSGNFPVIILLFSCMFSIVLISRCFSNSFRILDTAWGDYVTTAVLGISISSGLAKIFLGFTQVMKDGSEIRLWEGKVCVFPLAFLANGGFFFRLLRNRLAVAASFLKR